MATLDISSIRREFPALEKPQIYFDNAGGSQVHKDAIDSIHDYLLNNNVQHGGSYATSKKCMDLYAVGYKAAASYINASVTEIVFGSAVTQLFRNLSTALAPNLNAGDELIISALDHEANIASWVQMAEWKSLTIKWWTSSDRENPILDPEELKKLMSPKTKFVSCTHTSNILGSITDIKRIAEVVHSVPGAKLCVDGVAYMPHRPIDVKDLGVDFYAFSWYKVYGPHISLLYASTPTHSSLTSLSHFFKLPSPSRGTTSSATPSTLETLLGLAGCNYELVCSIPRVTAYLNRPGFWHWAVAHEAAIQKILLDYLTSRSDITVYGPRTSDPAVRVPVISFAVKGWGSKELVETIQGRSQYGFKWGHNYSYRLVEGVFGFGEEKVEDGVVRVSLCHYNTEEEVQGFVKLLGEVLGEKK